jgi:long-chain acyl-CoA synthetase
MSSAQEPDTFPKWLLQHARDRGARPAIREKHRGIWRTTSWRALADEVSALAGALADKGLQRGAHVVVVGDNRPRLYAAICAAQWLGAVALPLYQDAPAAEMAALIGNAQVTHAFAENQEQVDKLLALLPACPSLRWIICDKDRGMRHYAQPELLRYDALLAQGRALSAERQKMMRDQAALGHGDEAAFLFFTSGTTGPAKGVVLSHAALINRARVAAATAQLRDTDVAMAYLPPGWIAQSLFSYVQPMVVGYCVCCPESSETMLTDMREVGPTYLLAPPRVLEALLAQTVMRAEDAGRLNWALYQHCMALAQRVGARMHAGEAVSFADRLAYRLGDLLVYGPLRDVLGMSKLRVAYAAGEAIDGALLRFFRVLGINLRPMYGSTETGFFVALTQAGPLQASGVGAAAPGVELRFTAERELLVRSPGLFSQYHGAAQATAQAMDAEGWFRTGDVGWLGDNGQLHVIDRLAHVGALNDGTLHAPRPLENKLKFSPYVKEAVAFGRGRDHVCVLVDIDFMAVGRWADKRSLSYTGHADLASLDAVYGLIGDCISTVNTELAADPASAGTQIHRFAILPKALDADDGVLTRTGSLRREPIAERFAPLVEALYNDSRSVRLDAATEVKLQNAQVHAAQVHATSTGRKAA